MSLSVAVVGGSLGGLTTALVLRDAGHRVRIYERSPARLEARGAGIAVLDQTLRYPVERLGIAPEEISTETHWVRFLGPGGSTTYAEQRRYRFSAWNTIYRVLRDALGDEEYLLGREMIGFASGEKHADATFADGEVVRADLLVCADGISSRARRSLMPEVTSTYAGYVGWRGTVPENQLSPGTCEALCDAITYQVLPHSHILVYPIPGPKGELQPGRRLLNMVWYRNIGQEELAGFLTDRQGTPREISLPPGHVGSAQIDELRSFAEQHLAPPIAEMVTAVEQPFVQAVFDIDVPRMRNGRVCLIGDAAFAVRPHAAAGTAKAAEDGWVLAEELRRADGDIESALAGWERRQLALGRGLVARTREIGDRSQFSDEFRPGDPRLVFGLYGPGR